MTDYSSGAMSVDGIISNLKTSELIAKLMEVERKPIKILQNKQASYETKVTAWQESNAKLLALKSSISQLRYPSAFETKKATSSNENVLTASASTSAVPSVNSVKVIQLAKAHSISSDAQLIDEASTPLATKFGYAGDQTFTIAINSVSTSITIDTNDTLADMRDKINTSGAEVTATIINDTATTQKLILTSKNAGVSNRIELTDSADGLLNALALPLFSFYENFDYSNGPASGWTVVDPSVSSWVVQDGKYLGIGLGAASNNEKATLFNDTETDYEYSLKFEVQGGSGANYPYVGTCLRYNDENNWIRVELYNDGTNYIMKAITFEGGISTGETEVAIPNYSSGEHTLKIKDTGTQLDAYLDNTKFIENFIYNAGTISEGEKGLLANQATGVKFDNLKVGKNIGNVLQEAQDAIIEVNGMEVARDTNSISDAIEGVTLNLIKEDPTTTVSVSVSSNTEAVKTNITNFVTQYNNIISFFKDQFYYDSESKKSGTLFADSTLISIQKSLQDAVFYQVDARLTSEIIGMGDGGRGDDFGEFALSSEITSISDVKSIMLGTTSISFGGEGTGIGPTGWYAEVRLNGELKFFKDGVATPVENTKSIKVTYASAEEVNIQGTRYNLSKTINSIKNITRITAVYGGNTTAFTLRQKDGKYGSGYEVEINTDDTSSSNGELKFYDNNTLIAEGDLSDVKASYISSSALSSITQLGFSVYSMEDASIKLDDATLSSQLQDNLESVRDLFNKSYEALAYKVDDYLNILTQTVSGMIDLTITGIKSQVNSTKERISELEESMSYKEKTYRKMFNEMEKAIGMMQSQSTALSQQINRLPSSWMLSPRAS